MKVRQAIWIGLLIGASALLGACGGSDDPAPTGPSAPPTTPTTPVTPTPPTAPAQTQGTLAQLPPGVTLRGQPSTSGPAPDDPSTDTLVPISITLANDSDVEKKVVIPACFIFVAANVEYQNGINILERSIVLPAHTTKTVLLGTYCINLDRHAPTPGLAYNGSKVTDVRDLLKICELVNRKGSLLEAQMAVIQLIIWHVTDENGLTAEDLAWLQAL